MRKIIFLSVVLCISLFSSAQQKGYLYLKYVTPDNISIPYLDVSITDKADKTVQNGISDKNGKLSFIVVAGHTYVVQANGHEQSFDVSIPAQGYPVVTKSFVLPASFISNQTDTVWQEISEYNYPDANSRRVIVRVLNDNRDPQARIPVRLHLPLLKRVFFAYTSSNGEALFNIPYTTVVQLGIENYGAVVDIELPKKSNVFLTQQLSFQKYTFTDEIENDTITHRFSDRIESTTDRVLVKIRLFDYSGTPLADEPVYFNLKDSALVYRAFTNREGLAVFMIPKGQVYTMNLKYERDIDIFDYPFDFSHHTTEVDMSYIGSQAVEDFYKTTRRNKQGFIEEFMESKVSKLSEVELNKTVTEYGLFMNPGGSSSHVSTPLILNGKLYFSGGYYSKDFYATTTNGQFLWGLNLADNGPSAVVYADGYILIITESCSLYCINANNGELVWSKWLGPDMFHVPTVAEGKVFVSYPNTNDALHFLENKETYVMVAFQLETGQIAWQNPIDSEILGAAVYANKGVYVTTSGGSLYKFDATSGKSEHISNKGFVSMPTIVGNHIFITSSDTVASYINRLSAENLQWQSTYSQFSGKALTNKQLDKGPELMAFDKFRNVHFKGFNYISLDNKLIKYEPLTGKLVWKTEFKPADGNFQDSRPITPIVAGSQLIVCTEDGQMHLVDANSGKILQSMALNGELYCQPTLNNSMLVVGSNKGMLHLVSKWKITGNWPMWNFDAKHNTVIN